MIPRRLLLSLLIIPILISIGILIFMSTKHITESYINQGVPAVPLFIPLPSHIKTDFEDYVTHEDADWKKLCPSLYIPKNTWTPCQSKEDCGPAEICMKYNGDNWRCECSVANSCIYDSVC